MFTCISHATEVKSVRAFLGQETFKGRDQEIHWCCSLPTLVAELVRRYQHLLSQSQERQLVSTASNESECRLF